MTDHLEALCYLLDDELERQENILAICRAQVEAARRHDIEVLEARTAALIPLLQEAAQAEVLRSRLLAQIGMQAGLSSRNPSLSELIVTAEEPWTSRLHCLQERLGTTLCETKEAVRDNAGVLRSSLHVISQTLKTLEQCASPGPAYTAAGAEPVGGDLRPTVIDRRG